MGSSQALSWPGFPTFPYSYLCTNGFSAQGIAHAQAHETGMLSREHSGVQGPRQAEHQRG